MRFLGLLISSALLVGCAGKLEYVRPSASAVPTTNSKVIDKPRDVVWAQTVPELGKRFFVINNLDKASGLINISYSGDPERYVDCGQVTSYVKNAAGERTYRFPGSRAEMRYEVMDPGRGLFALQRKMSLDGRVNLIFEELEPGKTRVTANTRYGLQRTQQVWNASGQSLGTSSDSISLNSGGMARFPANQNGDATECVPTGLLEAEILSAVQ